MVEIIIKISNDEQTYRQKFLSYDEDIVLSKENPKLRAYVEQSIQNFKGNVDEVSVTIKMASW